MGLRYRLNVKRLPGKPDFVFARHHKVIFVHGCFWHRHAGCNRAKLPATRRNWWSRKLASNSARDRKVLDALEEQGWSTLVVWQCELRDIEKLRIRLREFFKHED
jgi:DNA mismatch endonuclease (patch repair protein)